jgi:sodium/hydrogen exchanger 8
LQAGLLSAYIIKTLYFGRHSTDREIAIMALMAYLSYLIAELCYLSGILTVFFCGIVMSHYTWHNVTEASRITTRHAFATMSFIAETFIFLYVGMDALDVDKWKMSKTRCSFLLTSCVDLFCTAVVGKCLMNQCEWHM